MIAQKEKFWNYSTARNIVEGNSTSISILTNLETELGRYLRLLSQIWTISDTKTVLKAAMEATELARRE